MNTKRSQVLFERAKRCIPGGVNSPVRAFKAVGGNPLFIKSAKGAFLYDEDDNRYIDLINSWGPMILGHGNEMIEAAVKEAILDSLSFGAPSKREVEMGELIVEMVPSIDKVRMVNSGTEATMSAIRLARGCTGKDKFIKFEGCYHGHGDSFLIAAGSGAVTMGTPDSPGVTPGTAKDTLLAPFNDIEAVKNLFDQNKGQIAAIILEPVVGNMGCVLPLEGFLEGLRTLCDQNDALLIFDEVMTGFRLASGGAQERFGVIPDLTTLGKIIGGGMPVGAYGGKAEIMDFVSPQGPVYQAGTLSGNPVAMAAGLAMLRHLYANPTVYDQLENTSRMIAKGIESNIKKLGLDYQVTQIGSMLSLFFTNQKVIDFESAKTSDTGKFGKYFNNMLNRGVYLAPSQFETLFISTAITSEIAEQVIEANFESLKSL
ncbi:MAG: glutamate-1-semialdehyde 2,1-aminomutase [Bacteroidetes bacterium]|nr:glutamate-1-semialdehyde 2,1-aminomutase [Bacteroidota bacterium]MDA1121444.1 glutamate-1-semialdehyde 2,1-aminomutase [Bacteroidota bacterium]